MNAVVRSFAARLVSFVPTILGTLLASRLIIDHEGYGILAFDSFALMLSLINLVPLNNLGVGAAVTSALASGNDRTADRDRAERSVLTAARVLTVSATGTAVVAAVLGVFGWWRPLLGEASGPDLWVGLALVVYALSFVPGLGTSMLLGVHRNHTTILVQTFFNPLNALFVAAIVLTGGTGNALVVVPCLSLVVVNVATSVMAARATGISWRRVAARLPRRRRFPGASIRSMSGPMFIVTLATPIALQSDRIVLSHVSTPRAVAEYSVALQVFSPALVLLAATAAPLFPIWTQARAAGTRGPGILRVFGLFTAAGAVAGVALGFLAVPAAHVITGSEVAVSPLLALAGGLWVVTASMAQPVAMSLLYPGAIKVVVAFTLTALPLNIGLSIVFARQFGAPGPLLATVLVGFFVQALPGLVYSHRQQRLLPVAAPAGADATAPHRPQPGSGLAAVAGVVGGAGAPEVTGTGELAPDTDAVTEAVTEAVTRRTLQPVAHFSRPAPNRPGATKEHWDSRRR